MIHHEGKKITKFGNLLCGNNESAYYSCRSTEIDAIELASKELQQICRGAAQHSIDNNVSRSARQSRLFDHRQLDDRRRRRHHRYP